MEKFNYSIEDWVQAYEEKVQEITKFKGYSIKKSSYQQIERLKNMYPDTSPFTFVEATFPPITIWWLPNKKGSGWRKLPYPYPNMLASKKAEFAYNNYIRQRKKEMGSKSDEILDGVKTSLDKLKVLNVKLTDFSELFYFTVDGTMSPYIFVCIDGAFEWYVLACNKGEIGNEWLDEFSVIRRYVGNRLELNKGIAKLVEEYARRD